MLSADIASQLNELGGTFVADAEGSFWRFRSGEFSVEAEPFKFKEKLGFDCAVEHRSFAILVNEIAGRKHSEFVCIKWFQCIQADDEAVVTVAKKVLSTAFSAPLADFTSSFRDHIPEKSIPQLCHLAALAMENDFITLMEYQDGFKKGKRRGFVPMVTSEMLDRAVNIALENA